MSRHSLVLTLVFLFGCSDSTSTTKDGGSSKGDTSGAAALTCSTFPASTVVSSLGASDQEKACKEFAACDARPYQDNPLEMFCDTLAMVSVGVGGGSYASNAEVQAACKTKKAECVANPASVGQAQSVLPSMLNRPCPAVVTCPWTMGKVEGCWKALRAASAKITPTCETMTVAMTQPKTTSDAGTLDLPPECQPLDDTTCLLISVGVTSR